MTKFVIYVLAFNFVLLIHSSSNHYETAKLLLEKGSDVNEKILEGATPIHIAAISGYSRLLRLFLQQPNCQINATVI